MNRLKKLSLGAIALSLLLLAQLFSSDQNAFSASRLKSFYDIFVCEEENVLAEAGLGPTCTSTGNHGIITDCGALTPRPAIPSLAQERPSSNLIPFVLVNNTGLPDSDVYFVIYGYPVSGCSGSMPITGDFSFVSFGAQPGPFTATGTTGGSATATGPNTPPSATYSYAFSNIPLTNGQRIIYIPPLESGIILYSVGSPLTLVVNANSIAIPVVTKTDDPSYNIVYGGMELTFYPSTCTSLNQLTLDFTCVDYYGLSIYMNLFTQNPLPGIPQNRPSGIYQSRHYTLCNLQKTLATAFPATRSQWTNLVLKEGSKILRVASPGYAMSHTGGTFDPNYFDNAAAYGYSWANDVWTGSGAYYKTNPLFITTGSSTTYRGQVSGTNFYFVNQSNTMIIYQIPWSDSSSPTTSTALFNVEVSFPNMQISTNGGSSYSPVSASDIEATQITEYLSATIVAGLVPGKISSMNSNGFPVSVIDEYYTPNPNLVPPGASTGPWYDLYSLGLLKNSSVTGTAVYTYAYDDYLYNQEPATAEVAPSQATVDDTTYVTIVLGPYSDN